MVIPHNTGSNLIMTNNNISDLSQMRQYHVEGLADKGVILNVSNLISTRSGGITQNIILSPACRVLNAYVKYNNSYYLRIVCDEPFDMSLNDTLYPASGSFSGTYFGKSVYGRSPQVDLNSVSDISGGEIVITDSNQWRVMAWEMMYGYLYP